MRENDIKISCLDAMHCFNALLIQIKHDTAKMENAPNPQIKEFYNRKITETKEVWNRLKNTLDSLSPTNTEAVGAYVVKEIE